MGCLTGGPRCGVAWNTLLLALICGAGTTALGLAFALVVARTNFRFKKLLRAMSILPIITPPFVIGLALILLFGRSGVLNHFLEWSVGIEPSRWFYGLPGLILAQLLSFTPIAFLVLIGVVEGVSPSMEEAAQTLRANRWRTFVDVSLPLMRPGLANAFLIGFIESIADFGNPIVLGGNFGVLATEGSIRWSVRNSTRAAPRRSACCCWDSRSRRSSRNAGCSAARCTRRCPARAIRGSRRRCPTTCASSVTRRRYRGSS